MKADDFHNLPEGTIVCDDVSGGLGRIKRTPWGNNIVVWDDGCVTSVPINSSVFTGGVVAKDVGGSCAGYIDFPKAAIIDAINEALERAAQECEKMIDAGAAKYAARIRALISGGGK